MNNLSILSHAAGAPGTSIAQPRRRLLTRILIPAMIVLIALAILGYSLRESLRPTLMLTTAPVVQAVRSSTPASGVEAIREMPGEIVQAPGWIEADPYSISVPALAPGVVKKINVLEGERISRDQVVAVLVDDDAVLAQRRAAAALASAEVAIAEAHAAKSMAEAKLEEARDASERATRLGGTGAISDGEVVALQKRLSAQSAALESAGAAERRALANRDMARVSLDEAELLLQRMQIRSPADGVVMVRLVEPGQRLMPDANNPFAGVVLRMYDPAHLQVRVDIPLADAGKVQVGDVAEITTETLPDRTFHGAITRFVHEADIQKNTVQVKVAIADPAEQLKPEMLAKVKITTNSGKDRASAINEQHSTSGMSGAMIVPRSAVVDLSGQQAAAWVLDVTTSTAKKRPIRIGRRDAETVEVLEGIQLGDRVVENPPANLSPGMKVKSAPTEEATHGAH